MGLHVRLEGHGERVEGSLWASRREGGLGLGGLREADEEGPSLPRRGILSRLLRRLNFPYTAPWNYRGCCGHVAGLERDILHFYVSNALDTGALRFSASAAYVQRIPRLGRSNSCNRMTISQFVL